MAAILDRDDGFIVTLEGHQPTITEQLQLLPFSQNLLCLPPLEFPPPPATRKHPSPLSGNCPRLGTEVRKYVLSIHDAHVSRLQKAKRFLSERKGTGRIVFLNGGFAAAQIACLDALKQELMWDADGVDMEEAAAREAEWAFQDMMNGGVSMLQHLSEEHPEPSVNRIPTETETIKEKMERMMGPTIDESTVGEDEAVTPRVMSPLSSVQSTAWASAAEKIDHMSKPSHLSIATIATVSTTAPRLPTPEEIEAGIEIGKAIAVHVRSRSNTTGAVVPPRYSPPPSPPTFRPESRRGGNEDRLKERRRAQRSQSIPPYYGRNAQARIGPKRKDPSFLKVTTTMPQNSCLLPPLEPVYSPVSIPTPPSSAKAVPDVADDRRFSHHSISDQFAHVGARGTVPPTRVPSPTPSSTADVSGATILPSPHYMKASFGGSPSSVGRLADEAIEPLFPSIEENLLVYITDGSCKDKGTKDLFERVLGDVAAAFSPRTPGSYQIQSQKAAEESGRRYLSPLQLSNQFHPHQHISTSKHESYQSYTSFASNETTRWSVHTTASATSRFSQVGSNHADPLSNIPKITADASKAPVEVQNEFRALMRQHFQFSPAASAPTVNEEEEEEFRWLQEGDEIDHIWWPVLRSNDWESNSEDVLCAGIDVLIAVGSEEVSGAGDSDEVALQGEELRKRLVERAERDFGARKSKSGPQGNKVGRVSLKYLLSSALPFVTRQHPELATPSTSILKGHFLLPEIERYISLNPTVRVLLLDFDFYTGSQAILSLRRLLACPTPPPDALESPVDMLKIACVADGATQISAKVPHHDKKSPNARVGSQIRIRTSYGQTTTSYTLSGWTPTSPNAPTDALKPAGARSRSVRRIQRRPWVPKQRLISVADILLPPLTTTPSSSSFSAAIEELRAALKTRERVTGYFFDEDEMAAASPTSLLPSPGQQEREDERDRQKSRKDLTAAPPLEGTSYYFDEGEDDEDEEEEEARKAAIRRRAKHGSKALRWLGLE